MTELRTRILSSPIGPLTAVASPRGLRELRFDERLGPGASAGSPVIDRLEEQLDEYFAGARRAFVVELDLEGTEFQRAAWTALAAIPFGETRTYGEQARAIGRPKAVRAVGAANGRNPVAIVLPCHRVVGADGALTGYAGGLAMKRFLLDLERRTPAGVR